MRTLWLGVLLWALVGTGCLSAREETPACDGGEAYRYDRGWYCIYTGSIIIEGFLCPEAMPHQFAFEGEAMGFGSGSGSLGLCAPSEAPPEGGWRELFEAWKRDGGEPGPRPDVTTGVDVAGPEVGPDIRDPDVQDPEVLVDTGPTLDVIEIDVSPDAWGRPCIEGLGQSACWTDDQCPDGWACAGATLDCTTCDNCEGATLGECFTSLDALALQWREGKRVALWAVSQVYTLIACPALTLETAPDRDGPWASGVAETACSEVVVPPYASSLSRAMPEVGLSLWTRVRGTLKTGCFSQDPGECQGEVELLSPPLAPAP